MNEKHAIKERTSKFFLMFNMENIENILLLLYVLLSCDVDSARVNEE